MKKNVIKVSVLIFSLFILFSCSSTKTAEEDLNETSSETFIEQDAVPAEQEINTEPELQSTLPPPVQPEETAETAAKKEDVFDDIFDDTFYPKNEWCIYKKNGQNIYKGPFYTLEEALFVWISDPKIKPAKKYYIGRNGLPFTNRPQDYYGRKYLALKDRFDNGETTYIPEEVKTAEDEKAELSVFEETQDYFPEEEPEITEKKEEEPGIKDLFPVDFMASSERTRKTYLSDFFTATEYGLPKAPEDSVSQELLNDMNTVSFSGETALMRAVKDGNDWKIRALIEAGADINAKDNEGWTALMYAVRYQSNLSIVSFLIDNGADVKILTKYGLSTAVMAACYNDNPDVIKKIISSYPPSDKEVLKAFVQLLMSRDETEFTLLAKMKVFLNYGLPVNSYYEGKTPLMYACKYSSSTKAVKLLLENKANSKVRSTEGKTAFNYAEENKKLRRDEIYWSLNKQ